jgi:hypothetical protein
MKSPPSAKLRPGPVRSPSLDQECPPTQTKTNPEVRTTRDPTQCGNPPKHKHRPPSFSCGLPSAIPSFKMSAGLLPARKDLTTNSESSAILRANRTTPELPSPSGGASENRYWRSNFASTKAAGSANCCAASQGNHGSKTSADKSELMVKAPGAVPVILGDNPGTAPVSAVAVILVSAPDAVPVTWGAELELAPRGHKPKNASVCASMDNPVPHVAVQPM